MGKIIDFFEIYGIRLLAIETLAAVAFLIASIVPFEAGAAEREITPAVCSEIEKRSFGFIKCRYRPESSQWRLTYMPTAYGQVLDSGEYRALLESLCSTYGDSIHETIHEIFRGRTREVSCFPENMPQVPTRTDDNLIMSKFLDTRCFKVTAVALTGHACVHPCPEHLAMALVSWVAYSVSWVAGFITLKGGTDA